MTTHIEKRCLHCQARYYYQSSGYGCNEDLNDCRYCPECMLVLSKALEGVPAKFEKVWAPISEVFGPDVFIDVDILLRWEREREKEIRDSGGLFITRVAFSLFDLSGKRTEHSGIVPGRGVKFQGYVFEYRYWTDNEKSKNWFAKSDEIREDIKITVEMERNLATGKLSKWQYFG
jgi:hypothetical protein